MTAISSNARYLTVLPFALMLPRIWSQFAVEAMGNHVGIVSCFILGQVFIAIAAALPLVLKLPDCMKQTLRDISFSRLLNAICGFLPLFVLAAKAHGLDGALYLLAFAQGAVIVNGYIQCVQIIVRFDARHILFYCMLSFALAAAVSSQLASLPIYASCGIIAALPLICAVVCRRGFECIEAVPRESDSQPKQKIHLAAWAIALALASIILGYFHGSARITEVPQSMLVAMTLYKTLIPLALALLFARYPRKVDANVVCLMLMVIWSTMMVVVYFSGSNSLLATAAKDCMIWSTALLLIPALVLFAKSTRVPLVALFGSGLAVYMGLQLLGILVEEYISIPLDQASLTLCCIYLLVAIVAVCLMANAKATDENRLIEARTFDGLNFDEICQAISPQCEKAAKRYGLTMRESELLPFLCMGLPKATIAKRFVISEDTVRTHVKQIYKKLDVHSHQELIETFWSSQKED